MDGLHLPPLLEETQDPPDERSEVKAVIINTTLMETREKPEETLTGEQELREEQEGRDAAQRQEELQGLLDDERLLSAHQAEAFTRQIQYLQAQLRSTREEMNTVDVQKEHDLTEAREELRSAQEEVQMLQQAAEEAAAERENDIASLQEELCRLRAELGGLENSAHDYELEMVTLRAEIAMKSQWREQERREGEKREGEVEQLRAECAGLKQECETLKQTNSRLVHSLRLLQRTGAGSKCVSMQLEETAAAVAERTVGSGSNCRLVDVSVQKTISFEGRPLTPSSCSGGFSEVLSLRDQLKQAEERAEQVQRQCDRVRTDLRELQDLFETSQKERAELELELLHCREELEKITDGSDQQFSTEPSVLSLPFLGMTVIVAILWCCWCELAG